MRVACAGHWLRLKRVCMTYYYIIIMYRIMSNFSEISEIDFAGNCFKPKRVTELLCLIQSHGESGRPFHKFKGIPINGYLYCIIRKKVVYY